MEFQRSHRVGEQIQKEISAILIKGLKDPRVGFVTITGVEVTRDLQIAKVYFTVMGDEAAKKRNLEGLTSSIPYIRREIGKRLRLRVVPEIRFTFDSSLEYGSRIESIIREINTERENDPGDTEED